MLVDQEQDEGKAQDAYDAGARRQSGSRDTWKGRETAAVRLRSLPAPEGQPKPREGRSRQPRDPALPRPQSQTLSDLQRHRRPREPLSKQAPCLLCRWVQGVQK